MKQTQRLDVFEFGTQLLQTKDLDPVYVMLHSANLPHRALCNWLLAYFCFYHCGTASWVTDASGASSDKYWDRLAAAARTAEHPRSSERRHFRGEQANKAVLELRSSGLSPTQLIQVIAGPNPKPTLQQVMGRVKELRGFGDWIAFKVADILERLGIVEVQFNPADIFNMYSEPRKGADIVWQEQGYSGPTEYMRVYMLLVHRIGRFTAPPRNERRINIQEIETILCKYKSHTNGHYPIGKDTNEIKHGLERYKHCNTAAKLLDAGQTGGLW